MLRPPEAPRPAPGPRFPSPATSSRGDARPAEEAGTSREAWGVGSACTPSIPTHHPHATAPGRAACQRGHAARGPGHAPRHLRHGPCQGSRGTGSVGGLRGWGCCRVGAAWVGRMRVWRLHGWGAACGWRLPIRRIASLGKKKTALQSRVAKKRWERSGGGKERPGSCPARPGEDEPGGTYLLLLGAELRGHAARRAGPSRAEPGCSRRRAPWRSPSPALRAPAPPGGEGGSAPGAPPKVPRKLK